MRHVAREVTLAMPRERAWALLSDLKLGKYYVPGVTDIAITTPNSTGVGASRKVFMGQREPVDETVIEWNEGVGFVVRLHKGELPNAPFREARFTYRLADTPDGNCRITTMLSYSLASGIGGWLLDTLLMRHIVGLTVKAISRKLKQVYETGVPQG